MKRCFTNLHTLGQIILHTLSKLIQKTSMKVWIMVSLLELIIFYNLLCCSLHFYFILFYFIGTSKKQIKRLGQQVFRVLKGNAVACSRHILRIHKPGGWTESWQQPLGLSSVNVNTAVVKFTHLPSVSMLHQADVYKHRDVRNPRCYGC